MSDPTRSLLPDPDPAAIQTHTVLPAEASAAPSETIAPSHDPNATRDVSLEEVVEEGFPDVPGYDFFRVLGRGGMGVVYHARQIALNREVAFKTVRGVEVSRTAAARFWAEAEVMAAVKHPHVVPVYELGEHAGRPFMAMEYLPGGSLAHFLAHRDPASEITQAATASPPGTGSRTRAPRLASHDAAALLEKIAAGVAAAHDLGIVHRDLKPGNVLLASSDCQVGGSSALIPKVTDFGLAKWRSADLTQTQALMGTPAYMAPEQAAGRAKFVGPTADVWALGVILYECLAGQRPFEGDSVQAVLSQIMSAAPAPLRTRERRVPRDLDTIVSRCLTKEPEGRYPSARELADDLGRFVRGEPIQARPVGRAERMIRWVRRKPAAAAAYGFSTLAVLLALVVFAVVGLWRDAEGARATAESARTGEAQARQAAETARDREVQARQGEAQARQAAETARDREVQARQAAETARQGEAQARQAAETARDREVQARQAAETARDNEVQARKRVNELLETEKRLSAELQLTNRNLVREREKIAIVEYGRTMQVAHQEWRDNNLSATLALINGTDPKLRGWEYHYVHRLCNSELLTFKGHTSVVTSAAFSPDGKRIVTGSWDRTAKVWDAATGAALLTLKGHTGWVTSAAFSPDGRRILTGSWDQTAKVWDAATGAALLTLKGHTSNVQSAAFSPDGKRIVTGSWDQTAKVWDAATGAELLTLKGHTSIVESAAFSPDGTRIVTVSRDESVLIWDSRPFKDSRPRQADGRPAW